MGKDKQTLLTQRRLEDKKFISLPFNDNRNQKQDHSDQFIYR